MSEWKEITKMLGKWKLLHDRIAIFPDKPKDTYGNGLIARPIIAQNAPLSGVVVAPGTDKENLPDGLKLGQRVFFNKYNIVEFQFTTDDNTDFVVTVLHSRDLYWFEDSK